MTTLRIGIAILATATACSNATSAHGDATTGDAAHAGDAAPLTNGVSTLAGAADSGDVDGDRATARFANPVNVRLGPDGTLYVADFDNGRIRTVDPAGNVTTLLSQIGFARPFGLAFGSAGVLYVETDNDAQGAHSTTSGTIWRLDIAARAATVIATGLGRPRGLAVLADGQLVFTDYAHHVIVRVDPSSGTQHALAGVFDAPGYVDGAGTAARFSAPYGIAVRADGKLVVADNGNHRVRLVDPASGATSTLAGTGVAGYADGALEAAEFDLPQAIAIDAADDIFVTDTNNYRVRRIRGTAVDTVAGNGMAGFRDADDRLAAEFYGLEGLAVSPDGTQLDVADGNRGDGEPYNRVRRVELQP